MLNTFEEKRGFERVRDTKRPCIPANLLLQTNTILRSIIKQTLKTVPGRSEILSVFEGFPRRQHHVDNLQLLAGFDCRCVSISPRQQRLCQHRCCCLLILVYRTTSDMIVRSMLDFYLNEAPTITARLAIPASLTSPRQKPEKDNKEEKGKGESGKREKKP